MRRDRSATLTALRPPRSRPTLRALDPAARYRDTATGAVHHGAVLLTHGLPLHLAADDLASTLVHLVREQN
ncbi:GH36 C-terminal domain-containing protein [Streptomyces griseus]|uniref:GH36 C-terminal domain-containing protein n=1 Tax=Streptomyces griseus TaxID=1911 RepID=UPI000AC34B3C|nr:GH36 C-terminal domain-containing protein [Streptomyces griseus]